MSIRPGAVTPDGHEITPTEEGRWLMDRKLIPFLVYTLLVAVTGCSQQAAPLPPAAPVQQPAIGNPCLPPGPCNYPRSGGGGFIR